MDDVAGRALVDYGADRLAIRPRNAHPRLAGNGNFYRDPRAWGSNDSISPESAFVRHAGISCRGAGGGINEDFRFRGGTGHNGECTNKIGRSGRLRDAEEDQKCEKAQGNGILPHASTLTPRKSPSYSGCCPARRRLRSHLGARWP